MIANTIVVEAERAWLGRVMAPKASVNPDAYAGNEEPRLAEMLADPICRRLMSVDRVEPAALMSVVADARRRLFTAR